MSGCGPRPNAQPFFRGFFDAASCIGSPPDPVACRTASDSAISVGTSSCSARTSTLKPNAASNSSTADLSSCSLTMPISTPRRNLRRCKKSERTKWWKERQIGDRGSLGGIGHDVNDRRMHLGPRPEDLRRHVADDRDVALGLHPDAEGAIVLRPRRGADPVGQFLLDRRRHRDGQRIGRQQVREDRRGDVVGQIRDELELPAGMLRPAWLARPRAPPGACDSCSSGRPAGACVTFGKLAQLFRRELKQPRVDFDRDDSRGQLGHAGGQRAQARADFQHHVARPQSPPCRATGRAGSGRSESSGRAASRANAGFLEALHRGTTGFGGRRHGGSQVRRSSSEHALRLSRF